MSKPLTGKVAVVTGSSRGIGRAIAKTLAADGALAVVHYGSSADRAGAVVAEIEAAGGSAIAIGADFADPKGPAHFIKQLDAALESRTGGKAFDILVNNAAIAPMGSIADTDAATLDRLLQVNVRAPFLLAQLASERLKDGGRVINVSSVVARHGTPSSIAYAGTKGFIEAFTKALAGEFAARNITVNAVAPGLIETDMSEPFRAGGTDWIMNVQALKRLGQPEDVAGVVRFLAGPDGRWTTAQTIDASGGTSVSF